MTATATTISSASIWFPTRDVPPQRHDLAAVANHRIDLEAADPDLA